MGTMVKVEQQNVWTAEQVELVKRTICKGATDDEMQLFMHQCRRTGLDPFSRQIHAVKRWDGREKREVMTIQTGIDGYRLIADRTGKYAGNDDPVYDVDNAPHPNKATVTVWKIVEGQRVPFTRSAKWSEFAQTTKDGELNRFWKRMPYLMLGKVAEALALRAAFPQELSGLYTHEEMGQADSETEVETPRVSLPPPQPKSTAPAAEPVEGQHTPQSPPKATNGTHALPANGAELLQRLTNKDATLANEGVCKPGELLDHVLSQGVNVCGYPGTLLQWAGQQAMQFAVDVTNAFIALRQKRKPGAAPADHDEPSEHDQDGIRLVTWLKKIGRAEHAAQRCANEDDLYDNVLERGHKAGFPTNMAQWVGDQIRDAMVMARHWLGLTPKQREQDRQWLVTAA